MKKLLGFSLLMILLALFVNSSELYSQKGKGCGQGKGCGSSCTKFVDANGDGKCDNFVDANGDGKCDNCPGKGACNGTGTGCGQGKGCGASCGKFVDANGDGKCDNFVDANGDGKCDNCSGTGTCKGTGQGCGQNKGMGQGQGCGQNKGMGLGKGCGSNGCAKANLNKPNFNINQNTPNPVQLSGMTKITVNLKEANDVKVAIFDYAGNRIKEVFSGKLNAGDNVIEFSSAGIDAGNYMYAVEVAGKIQAKQMMIIK